VLLDRPKDKAHLITLSVGLLNFGEFRNQRIESAEIRSILNSL